MDRMGKINKKGRKYQAVTRLGDGTPTGVKYGNRALKVISIDIDDIRCQNAQREIVVRMGHMKADVVCIQETRNTRTEDKCIDNYRYISAGSQK